MAGATWNFFQSMFWSVQYIRWFRVALLSTETVRTVRDVEPRTAISSFAQLLTMKNERKRLVLVEFLFFFLFSFLSFFIVFNLLSAV